MIEAYFKFVLLPDDVKALNGIKGKKRLDCTRYTGTKEIFLPFENKRKPTLSLILAETQMNNSIKTKPERMAKYFLWNNGLNLSSIYLKDSETIGYGYPNSKPFLKNGLINPMYDSRDDGYLFIVNKDYTEIEILVFLKEKGYIETYADILKDNGFDDELEFLRNNSKPYYNYKGL